MQDNWEEVGNGVGGGGAETRERGENPDFQTGVVAEEFSDLELGRSGIGTIIVDAGDDKVDFLVGEEVLVTLGLVGKVDEEEL